MQNSIYPETSQAVNEIFERIGDFNKILIVPIDYAKQEHTVQFCLANGVYLLKKPLRVFNTLKGSFFLRKRILKMCKKLKINYNNVILVCEDPPSYMKNFIFNFKKDGFNIFRVNASEAAKYRKSSRISNDERDLDGITQCVINRKAYEIYNDDKYYLTLKRSIRSRRKLVKLETQLKNQIHALIDILFPNFLNEKQSGGKENLPFTMKLPKKCNKILKDALIQAGHHVGKTFHPIRKYTVQDGSHFLMQHFQKVENRDGCSRLSTAKLLIKIIKKIVVEKRFYFPKKQEKPVGEELDLDIDDDLIFYIETLKYVKKKLAKYNLNNVPENENYLVYEENTYEDIMKLKERQI